MWLKCNYCGKHKPIWEFNRRRRNTTNFGVSYMCTICCRKVRDKGTGRPRGRPVGCRLSYTSREKIADSKRGSSLPPKVRDKISATLKKYYNETKCLSTDLLSMYKDKDLVEWIKDNQDLIDLDIDDVHIYTNKHLQSHFNNELNSSDLEYIENLFVDELTPEIIVLVAEEVQMKWMK